MNDEVNKGTVEQPVAKSLEQLSAEEEAKDKKNVLEVEVKEEEKQKVL